MERLPAVQDPMAPLMELARRDEISVAAQDTLPRTRTTDLTHTDSEPP